MKETTLSDVELAALDEAHRLETLYGANLEYGGPPCNAALHRALTKLGTPPPHPYTQHQEEEE